MLRPASWRRRPKPTHEALRRVRAGRTRDRALPTPTASARTTQQTVHAATNVHACRPLRGSLRRRFRLGRIRQRRKARRASKGPLLLDKRASLRAPGSRLGGKSSGGAGRDRCASTKAGLRDRPVGMSLTVGLDESEQWLERAAGRCAAAPVISGRLHWPEPTPAPDDTRARRPSACRRPRPRAHTGGRGRTSRERPECGRANPSPHRDVHPGMRSLRQDDGPPTPAATSSGCSTSASCQRRRWSSSTSTPRPVELGATTRSPCLLHGLLRVSRGGPSDRVSARRVSRGHRAGSAEGCPCREAEVSASAPARRPLRASGA